MFEIAEFERIKMVRCIKDPMLPIGKPKQALYIPDIPDCEAYLHTLTGNVWFYFPKMGRKFMVGIGNVEISELYPDKEILPKTVQEMAQQPKHRRKSIEIIS